ncbi:transglycosylase SLT domain-containing protein [Rhodobacterales bacterium HKCCE2091]|nr:transglycosylase SLT domain-containing protein [Rhodobacterales bacterium HKCCE2091]
MALAGVLFAESAAAQASPPPFPEFSFRRVTPPGPDHRGPLIDIHIEPAPEPDPAEEPELADIPPEAALGASGWFWAEVPAGLEAPGRTRAALELLARAPEADGLNILRLDDLNRLASEHGREILSATVGTEVSPALVLAVMAVESAGRADAVSGAGAQGLMQLIPATADRFDVADPFDPEQNIAGGVAYLSWLLGEFGGDPILALAGYNAGEGAVWRSQGVPDYDETRDYVPKVLATWDLARMLCATPPQFVSDGCVFANMVRS